MGREVLACKLGRYRVPSFRIVSRTGDPDRAEVLCWIVMSMLLIVDATNILGAPD